MKIPPLIIVLAALVVAACVVSIGWGAVDWFPAANPVAGNWRPNYAADCSERTYLVIGKREMHLLRNGVPDQTVTFAIAVSGTAARPLIRVTFPQGASGATMDIQAVVSGDAMTFESADWSRKAIETYGRDYLESQSPAQTTLATFRSIEPLRRCP